MNRTYSTAAWVLASALLFGCAEDPDQLIASARESLQQHETQTAIIQLKNALQQRTDSPEARFLLGRALLESGDGVAAAVELKKARELKHPDVDVLPPLARALLRQGEFKTITGDFAAVDLADAAAQADLKTSVATAFARQGNRQASESALQAALAAVDGHAPALVLQARMQAGDKQFDSALAILDKVLAQAPGNVHALELKGDVLLRGKGDQEGALEAYRKVLALQSDFLAAHTGIIMVQLARKNLAAAAAQVDAMKKVLPKHPATRYFEALMAFEKADYKTAGELVAQLLKSAPEDRNLLYLAGAVEFRKGALRQAETNLQKVLTAVPAHRQTRLLLAQIYARTGQSTKVLDMVEPLLAGEKPDAAALSLAAQSHLQAGDAAKAEELFGRAAKLNPDDPKAGTALALTRMSRGETEAAFGELERIASADSGTTADLALISAHLRRRDFANALKAVDSLERKNPGQAMTEQLRGTCLVGLRQAEAARASFERALKRDPLYFPAAASLAALDLSEKKPQDAEKRFDALLAQQPEHLQALLAVAGLRKRNGGSHDEVAALLSNAIKLNPTAAAPRLQLIEHHLAAGQAGPALVVAQEAAARLPADLQVLDALGRAQVLDGNANQAIATFNKFATLQPKSALPHVRLADVYMAAKDSPAAQQSLQRALAITPNLLAAQRNLMLLQLAEGRSANALAVARDVQKQRPKEAVGFLLEGDVHAAGKKWGEAIAAYRAGLKAAPGGTPAATKLHAAFLLSGKQPEADNWADTWLRDHPKDAAFLAYLGEGALHAHAYKDAEQRYLRLVELHPDNVLALNNLAWAMTELKRPGAAAYAQKATKLQPDQPVLMDTLAAALAAENQLAKALEVQRKVVELAPDTPEFRLRLARLYVQSGQGDKARPELDRLANLGEKFKGQAEVAQLMKAL